MNPFYISNIVILCVPVLVGVVVYVYQMMRDRSPSVDRLEKFAQMAVQYVEQYCTNRTSIDKKTLAMNAVIDLCKEFHLPAPSDEVLSCVIESAVLLLNQMNQTTTTLPAVARATRARIPMISNSGKEMSPDTDV